MKDSAFDNSNIVVLTYQKKNREINFGNFEPDFVQEIPIRTFSLI